MYDFLFDWFEFNQKSKCVENVFITLQLINKLLNHSKIDLLETFQDPYFREGFRRPSGLVQLRREQQQPEGWSCQSRS